MRAASQSHCSWGRPGSSAPTAPLRGVSDHMRWRLVTSVNTRVVRTSKTSARLRCLASGQALTLTPGHSPSPAPQPNRPCAAVCAAADSGGQAQWVQAQLAVCAPHCGPRPTNVAAQPRTHLHRGRGRSRPSRAEMAWSSEAARPHPPSPQLRQHTYNFKSPLITNPPPELPPKLRI